MLAIIISILSELLVLTTLFMRVFYFFKPRYLFSDSFSFSQLLEWTTNTLGIDVVSTFFFVDIYSGFNFFQIFLGRFLIHLKQGSFLLWPFSLVVKIVGREVVVFHWKRRSFFVLKIILNF